MRFAHYTICKEDESLPCGTSMAGSTTFQVLCVCGIVRKDSKEVNIILYYLYVCISICNQVFVLIAVRDTD